MIVHPPVRILFVADKEDSSLQPLLSYLGSIHHVEFTLEAQLPRDFSPYDVVATANTAALVKDDEQLTNFVHRGGGWLGLVRPSDGDLPQIFGAQPDPVGPAAELRVLFKHTNHPLAIRLADAFYLQGCYRALNKTSAETETILYADWQYQHSPVLVYRLKVMDRLPAPHCKLMTIPLSNKFSTAC